MRSVLAPNRQAFSLASWNVMLSILASRHLMPWACESIRLSSASMCLVCSPMWASICAGQRRQFGGAQTLQIFGFEQLRIEHVCILQAGIGTVIGAFLDCSGTVFAVGIYINTITY